MIQHEDEEKLYFVVETKDTLFTEMLNRPAEQAKIDCGREHFKALGESVGFTVANKFDTFMDKIAG